MDEVRDSGFWSRPLFDQSATLKDRSPFLSPQLSLHRGGSGRTLLWKQMMKTRVCLKTQNASETTLNRIYAVTTETFFFRCLSSYLTVCAALLCFHCNYNGRKMPKSCFDNKILLQLPQLERTSAVFCGH